MIFLCVLRSIGYPVVTLGFGFKSYVGYRMRQRKQREVAKENEFYMQLLQQALPQEEPTQAADETQTVVAANASNSNAVAAISSTSHGAQNHHQNNSLATGASINAAHTHISNSIATANGSAALAQIHNHQDQHHQNHPHHHHQQQQQQQSSLHNNHNGNCLTANGSASMASSAASHVTGVANSNFSSSSTSSSSNNTTSSTSTSSASYLSTTLTTASSSSTTNDDKSYVQIGGGSGGKLLNAFKIKYINAMSSKSKLKVDCNNCIYVDFGRFARYMQQKKPLNLIVNTIRIYACLTKIRRFICCAKRIY